MQSRHMRTVKSKKTTTESAAEQNNGKYGKPQLERNPRRTDPKPKKSGTPKLQPRKQSDRNEDAEQEDDE